MPSTDPSLELSGTPQALTRAQLIALEQAIAAQQNSIDTEGDTPDIPSLDYTTMEVRWDLINDLRGGTPRMRDRAEKWLPKEENESQPKYDLRVSRSFLLDHYSESVARLSSRPFARHVSLVGEVPSQLRILEEDVNRQEMPLTDFAQSILHDAVHYGKTHVLVDFSRMPLNATRADDLARKPRTSFIHIKAADLIGWRIELTTAGHPVLTEIRWREQVIVYTGNYTEELRERVRIYSINSWELWEKQKVQDKWQWIRIDQGVHSFGRIPLVTLYTHRVAPLISRPALEGLAWRNLAHFQSASEQRNLLRFARIGILFGKGLSQDDVEEGINLAPNAAVLTTSENADLKYVEHNGGAMEIGAKDLETLERQMDVAAMQPFIQSATGVVSATGQAIEEAKSVSALQGWARATEVVLRQAYRLAAEWHKVDLPKDFKVDIFSDFSITPRVRDDVLALLEARSMGEISHMTLLEEIQRRGIISDHRNIKEEVEEAKKDGPSAGAGPSRLGGTGIGPRDADPNKRNTGGDSDNRTPRGADKADGHDVEPT